LASAVTVTVPMLNAVALPVTLKLASAVILKVPVPRTTCEASGISTIESAVIPALPILIDKVLPVT
jgi:Na+/serine symporter